MRPGPVPRAIWHARVRARRVAVATASWAQTTAGQDRRRAQAIGRDDRVLILNLHAMKTPGRAWAGGISPEVLDGLITWLKAHCRLVTIGDLGSVDPSGPPLVVLSFDDGYRDFLDHAVPVLERHAVRVNQNVIPGCVDRGAPPWNVHLLDCLASLPGGRLGQIRVPGADVPLPLAWASPHRYAELITLHLKALPREEREARVAEITERAPEISEVVPRAMLNVEEVQAIAQHHEVGAHSFDHDSMALETDQHFAQDVDRCRAWFDRHGLPMGIYAFPNGSHRPEQIEIARDRGIEHALLVGERPAIRTATALHRITLFGGSARELRARMARAAT